MEKIHALRLKPGQDLKVSIQEFAVTHNIRAGWVITAVGSLTQGNLRLANRQSGTLTKGFYEIISLSGTVSVNGSHLHIAISDGDGIMTGGHLMKGCIVFTTAEIILGESTGLIFTREHDGSTEWKELQIS